jgi:hypothetical protein
VATGYKNFMHLSLADASKVLYVMCVVAICNVQKVTGTVVRIATGMLVTGAEKKMLHQIKETKNSQFPCQKACPLITTGKMMITKSYQL